MGSKVRRHDNKPTTTTTTLENSKKLRYLNESKMINQELKEGNEFLANRLNLKVEEYSKYIAIESD